MPRIIPVLAAAVLVAAWAIVGPARAQPADSWLDNDDMLLLYEALTKAGRLSIAPETGNGMVHKAVKGYLRQLDAFSDLLTPDEYARYQRAMSESYVGVGMEIFGDRLGRVLCLPYPGSPAARAGIGYGDELLFVDGSPVEGRSVYMIGADIRGPELSSVSLTVGSPSGEVKSAGLVRQQVQRASVAVSEQSGLAVIRIYHFDADTDQALGRALAGLDPLAAKVVDLRGNTGGDFHAAVRAASLFLEPGRVVVDKRTKTSLRTFRAGEGDKDRSPLVLWQDGFTASAAEVFVGALTGNHRAVSLGRTSFGKGVAQAVVELSDGSVMFVTDGALRTPKGVYYHQRGLEPDYPLDRTGDGDCLAATRELLRSGRVPGP